MLTHSSSTYQKNLQENVMQENGLFCWIKFSFIFRILAYKFVSCFKRTFQLPANRRNYKVVYFNKSTWSVRSCRLLQSEVSLITRSYKLIWYSIFSLVCKVHLIMVWNGTFHHNLRTWCYTICKRSSCSIVVKTWSALLYVIQHYFVIML